MFPTIFKMEKLETLEIRSCHQSLEFPEIQANMERLVQLSLNRIGIEGLLSSIGERCTSLISLHLSHCFILNSIEIDFNGLKHLKDFRIRGNTLPGKMPLDLFTEKVFPQLMHRLQRLDLVDCCLEGEIPSAIGELPQLPSSIAILMADYCNSLTDVEDFYVNCKRLTYASLKCSNMVIDRNRFLQSMLQGETAENHYVSLQLQGLEIPKGFTPCLRDGRKCTLRLPENWSSDFEQVITGGSMGMDSEDVVIWKESVGDGITWVEYIPFASLRHTEWWDSTYKKVSFSIDILTFPSGFGVRLVHRKGRSGPTETSAEISTNSSGISDGKDDYTPGFQIFRDSKNYLIIIPRIYDKQR
ncbi:Toll/interleukin-1 receptor domain-containing protein [Tanacetum coccineum]